MCGGLPSGIVLLGGLLSTKAQSYDEWSRVINYKNDILALSYQDLPSQVKPCFLYMWLFPRGFEIRVRRLIHLWCAERFLSRFAPEDIDPESQAEMCIKELVLRNMIQVRWKLDGSPKTCFMHNVVYDFFSRKAANLGFINHQLESSNTSLKQSRLSVRRLAAYVGIKSIPSSFLRVENLRSYTAFETRIRAIPDRKTCMFLNKIISNRGFALLNALDLEGVYKPVLSNDVVGKLIQLKYLGLKSTFIDELPEAVGSLPCLETLDVRQTNIYKIQISNAKKLQHLYLNQENYTFWKGRDDTPEDFLPGKVAIPTDLLSNLRTLWDLIMKYGTYDPEWLKYLTRLTKLKVTAIDAQKDVAQLVSRLTNLQSLKLRSLSNQQDGYSFIKLGTLAEDHKLQDLYFLGKLPKDAIDIHFLPPSLTNLTLSLSKLGKDPMPVLGQLPHLHILRLFGDSYIGKQMTCLPGGFAKLRLLKLWKLSIENWTVEDGAMPCLRELEIRGCNNLKPAQGLHNLITLRELVLTNMEESFGKAVEGILKSRNTYIKINNWFLLLFM